MYGNKKQKNQEDRPLRVLQVVTIMNRAGLETMLMNYYRHIDKSKIQFDFLVHRNEKGQYDDEIKSLGGRIYRVFPVSPLHLIKYYSSLNKFFSKHGSKYNIVHSHLDALSAPVLKIAKKYGIKNRIAHSHTNNFDKDFKLPIRYIAKKFIKFYATEFAGCSQDAIDFMFGRCKNSTIIPNAINLSKYKFDEKKRNKIRKEFNLEKNFVLGHVGRFDDVKNHTFLADIFYEVQKKQPNSRLMLVGEGELKEKIYEKFNNLGIKDKVLFLGSRNDVPDLMQSMDVFVLPSKYEGLGIVLVEAQASGLPCICSDRIPNAVKLSDGFNVLSLNASLLVWSDLIIKNNCVKRIDNFYKKIIKNQYDIISSSDRLCKLYIKGLS